MPATLRTSCQGEDAWNEKGVKSNNIKQSKQNASQLTLGEEPTIPGHQMLAQEPAIAKLVISLDQFNAITLGQAQLVRTPCLEVVCENEWSSAAGATWAYVESVWRFSLGTKLQLAITDALPTGPEKGGRREKEGRRRGSRGGVGGRKPATSSIHLGAP